MKKKLKTVWFARDRKGDYFFSERPVFIAMHDVFLGKKIDKPKEGSVRIIRRFTAPVQGNYHARLFGSGLL